MKIVLLAGGLGTRLSEETVDRPKPMVEIGGQPILWHIMQMYAAHGFDDFVVACGYKGDFIKDWFAGLRTRRADFTVDLRSGEVDALGVHCPSWRVTLIDTGLHTQTGGRIRRLSRVLGREPFMVTYGDGVGDIDIAKLVAFHRAHGKLATITAVRPPARFGVLDLRGSEVAAFAEKPQAEGGWINGGFFVFEPGALDYLDCDDAMPLEREPLERLAALGQLMAYQHEGFWQPMDTLRDKRLLERLWDEGRAPWRTWS
ncbi:glucose-1-phosphate cytidylyltransferase [Sorangium sp. So ce291]|uniref:glucose-1-phosphate cytidylyltransferase n=1 Tax=Sorangium sp. So ce291 TaxID=3133294 RepID=UPI003F617865